MKLQKFLDGKHYMSVGALPPEASAELKTKLAGRKKRPDFLYLSAGGFHVYFNLRGLKVNSEELNEEIRQFFGKEKVVVVRWLAGNTRLYDTGIH